MAIRVDITNGPLRVIVATTSPYMPDVAHDLVARAGDAYRLVLCIEQAVATAVEEGHEVEG